MASGLWRNINYKTPVKYYINTYIREYDLSKANINALLYQGRIDKSQYNIFYNMDKKQREITIGKMISKDRTIYQDIQSGIKEAKRKLFLTNNIEDLDIVSIKNDAVFIVGKYLKETEFPPFTFIVKNEYNIFLQLQELEIYYSDFIDNGGYDINIDVKGIGDNNLLLHQNGMLDLICEVCRRLQRESIDETMSYVSMMYSKFINRELGKEYYRNFDSFSMYIIPTFMQFVQVPDISEDMKYAVDINRNLSIMRNLVGIISDIYRQKKRRG
jgi:hypothetical protein